MDHHVRELLLHELRSDPEFGPLRVKELADFLLTYSARSLKVTDDAELRDFLALQQWTALAYIWPEQAAEMLAAALGKRLQAENRVGILRLASLTRALAPPLIGQDKVLLYAAGVERLAAGDRAGATSLFDSIGPRNESVNFGTISLPAPDELVQWLLPPTMTDTGPPDIPSVVLSLPPGFKLRHTLGSHNRSIGGMKWSPDGSKLASFSMDRTIRTWNVDTGQPEQTFKADKRKTWCLAWSPDGYMLAAGSGDGISVWDAEKGTLLSQLKTGSRIYALTWTPDGLIISGDSEGIIDFWQVQTQRRRDSIEAHKQAIYALACSPDGQMLASASKDKKIGIWRIQGRELQLQLQLQGHTGWVTGLAWASDGRLLASASTDKTVRIWDKASWQTYHVISGHTDEVYSVSFSPDNRLLASASSDHTIRLWDNTIQLWETAVGTEIARLDAPHSPRADYWPSGGEFHPTSNLLAVPDANSTAINILDLEPTFLLSKPTPGAQRARIFLGYKRGVHPDEEIALEAHRALSKNHYVFIDQALKVGEIWTERIKDELHEADYFIVFLSEKSVQSEMMLAEIEMMFRSVKEREAAIIPVRVAYQEPFRYPLSAYLDRFNSVYCEGMEDAPRLIEDLITAVSGKRSPEFFRPDDEPVIPEPVSVQGTWRGVWEKPGVRFTFQMQLEETEGGEIEGGITWRREETLRRDMTDLIGDTAVEYVRGSFDRESLQFTLEGYGVSRPGLIAIDKYRIQIANDGQSFKGNSETNEKNWAAVMTAIRLGSEPAQDISNARRAQIFISYRHVQPDQELALFLANHLKEQSHDIFVDTRISAGTEWTEWVDEIERRIRASDFFVVLLSAESIRSDKVRNEVWLAHKLAQNLEKPFTILPIRVAFEGELPYDLAAYLDHFQYVLWRGPEDTPRVIEQLMRVISGEGLRRVEETSSPASTRLEMPGGAMHPSSAFYVERYSDTLAMEAIQRQGVTLVIKGPRQMGKSSLLVRIVDAASKVGKEAVFLDFQLLDSAVITNAETFFRQFCSWVTDILDLEDRTDEFWRFPLGNTQRCTRYFGQYLLKEVNGPFVLAMDEADRIFDTQYRSDFFGMLRSWHNSRSINSIWKQIDIVLSLSTEPYALIDNLNQSPFNVGEVIELKEFSREQVAQLNQLHGSPLSSGEQEQLMNLVSGQPYLIGRALDLISSGRFSFSALLDKATDDEGPFGDHLRYFLLMINNRRDLAEGLREVMRTHRCKDQKVFFRLYGAGLIRREGNTVSLRNKLYDSYFREHFAAF